MGQSAISNAEISWSIPESEDTTGLSADDLTYVLKEFHVQMNITEAAQAVQVKMGPEEDMDDFFGRTFSLGENAEFEDGSAIIVNGTSIDVRLGYFQGLRSFKLRLTVLDNSGGVLEYTDLEYPL